MHERNIMAVIIIYYQTSRLICMSCLNIGADLLKKYSYGAYKPKSYTCVFVFGELIQNKNILIIMLII